MKNKAVAFFEIHYLFNDDSHTIDAFVRNQCEKELLQIIYHSLKEFNLNEKVKIESTPSQEGCFLETIQFLGENRDIAGILVAVLIGILQILRQPQETELDKTLKREQIENTRLDSYKKILEIKKNRKRIRRKWLELYS